jgi:hypothetical protein
MQSTCKMQIAMWLASSGWEHHQLVTVIYNRHIIFLKFLVNVFILYIFLSSYSMYTCPELVMLNLLCVAVGVSPPWFPCRPHALSSAATSLRPPQAGTTTTLYTYTETWRDLCQSTVTLWLLVT